MWRGSSISRISGATSLAGQFRSISWRRAVAGSGAAADQLDDFVDIGNGNGKTDQDMRPVPCLASEGTCPPPMTSSRNAHECLEHVREVINFRFAAVERHHVAAERGLQLGEPVELVEDHIGDASRFSSITTRMPERSIRHECRRCPRCACRAPVRRSSRSSLTCSPDRDLVTMIASRSLRTSSTSTLPRMTTEPRPVS
jgi:hypothetical protein